MGSFFYLWPDKSEAVLEKVEQVETELEIVESVKTHIVSEGDVFATVIEQYGFDYIQMQDILAAAEEVYDFTKIRIGKPINFIYIDGLLDRFEYEPDNEVRIVVRSVGDEFVITEEPIEYEVEEVLVSATINDSLFLAATGIGVEESVVLNLAEILAWSIDFATAIREGDSFTLLYEKRKRNGEEAPPGRILAAQFFNREREYTAFRYELPEDKVAYYNREGENLVKQFLKAPLRFSRITSGFAYSRFHPVIGKSAPHLAIDYAAPAGTPVLSVGDGTVTYAGWNGGFGNYINIRHNDIYQTQYAHLSGYARGLRKGSQVTQGQIIGFVGSTGWSTGPHLHYQIKRYGTLVNPLTIELPAGDPVPGDLREDFYRVRDELASKVGL